MMYHSDLIEHRERKKQIICFDGMRYGNITPMDIDLCIEYHDKAVVFVEYKYDGAQMPDGQRLCLQRLADDITKAGKVATVLLAEHNVADTSSDVVAEQADVIEVYWKGRWRYGDGRNVGQYVDGIIAYADCRKPYTTI